MLPCNKSPTAEYGTGSSSYFLAPSVAFESLADAREEVADLTGATGGAGEGVDSFFYAASSSSSSSSSPSSTMTSTRPAFSAAKSSSSCVNG
jgi:hypothetical protein